MRAVSLLAVSLIVFGSCTGPGEPVTGSRNIALSFTNLEDLGNAHTYHAWLQDGPSFVHLGSFEMEGTTPSPATYVIPEAQFVAAEALLVSIESTTATPLRPSAQRILAGEINGGSSAALSVADRRALGDPFTEVGAQYVLETRTTPQESDYAQGIYWCAPGVIFDIPEPVVPDDPNLDITLPTLPTGWVYEGWVVHEGTPVSTGRILTPMAPDSDGLGPAAGPAAGLPFPGQEFITPPLTIPGGEVMMTVEPEPDYSPEPFPLTVLRDTLVEDRGPATLQWTENVAAATRPSGNASFTFVAAH